MFFRNFIFFFILLLPGLSHAHVKWFVKSHLIGDHDFNLLYTVVWFAIAILAVELLKRLNSNRLCTADFITHHRSLPAYYAVFLMVIGAYYLWCTINGFILSPGMSAEKNSLFLYIQSAIALSYILGYYIRAFTILNIVFYCLLSHISWVYMIETLWVLGFSLAILTYHFAKERQIQQDLSLDILRLFFGMNLIILGFSEKLLHPQLGLQFLEEHKWNFMHNSGFTGFSDEMFVFSAGAVEILFGIAILMGYSLRISSMALLCIFLIPVYFLGIHELIGHLPLATVLVGFILFGNQAKPTREVVSGIGDLLVQQR